MIKFSKNPKISFWFNLWHLLLMLIAFGMAWDSYLFITELKQVIPSQKYIWLIACCLFALVFCSQQIIESIDWERLKGQKA